MDTASVVARAEISTPVQPVARAAIVDVQDHRRRSSLGHISRRNARFVSERDVVVPDILEVREPVPDVAAPVEQKREIQPRQRRYPRRILHDHYEKREPATSVKETTVITTKNTVFDTPADASALASVLGSQSGSAAAALVGVVGGDGSSTVLSVSQTTTIASPDASATATATAKDAAATATSTATNGGDAAAADATASASASATASADAAGATATDASSTSSAAAADATGAAGDDKAAGDSNAGGDGLAIKVDGDSTVPKDAAAGDDTSTATRRRWVKDAPAQPIARRTAVGSGASWASVIRRQLMNSH